MLMQKKKDLILDYAPPAKKRGTRWGLILLFVFVVFILLMVALIV